MKTVTAIRVVLAAVLGVVLLTACKPMGFPHLPKVSVTKGTGQAAATTVADAASCTGTVTFIAGSMPPPYHYEWTLTVDGVNGTLAMTPGYGDKTVWSKKFTAPLGADDVLCKAVHAVGPGTGGEEGVGGSLVMAALNSDGHPVTYHSPGDDNAVIAAAKAFIPTAVWTEVDGKYQAWASTH